MVGDGSVPCPLSNCTEGRHEIRTDRSGNPYVACKSWKVSIWLNRGIGTEWLEQNNGGGGANASFPRAAPPRRRGRVNPGGIPGVIEVPDRPAPEYGLGHCTSCNGEVGSAWIGKKCPNGCGALINGEAFGLGPDVPNPTEDDEDEEDGGDAVSPQSCPRCGEPVPYHSGACRSCGLEVKWDPD